MKKTIGILGGMGPQASITFYKSIIEYSQKIYNASTNADFPHILLSNLPVPDVIQDKIDEEKAITMVEKEARMLEQSGADFLVIPCNTMHIFLERYQKKTSIPFLSMIEIVSRQVSQDRHKKIGLLGSKTLLQSELYQENLKLHGIEVMTPSNSNLDKLAQAIKKIIAGTFTAKDRYFLVELLHDFKHRSAEAVILGCTELPLVLDKKIEVLPLYNSLDLLALASCKKIYEDS